MKYSLLAQFEKTFHRTPFKAVESMTEMSADEQRWFVYQFRVKDNPELKIQDVEEWNTKDIGDAVGDFFGVSTPLIPV
jgi:hypothetical protein